MGMEVASKRCIRSRTIKDRMIRNSRVLGVPNVIWAATAIGLVAGAASGAAAGDVWITVIGGIGAGTAILAPFLVQEKKPSKDLLIYDSDTEDPAFSTWTYYAERGVTSSKFNRFTAEDGKKVIGLTSRGGEVVGVEKAIALTAGVVEFDYMAVSADPVSSIFFAMLPMRQTMPDQTGLIEAGGSVQDDPANPASPYRIRYFIPREHCGDSQWHHHRMEFDFDGIPDVFYTIFAPRINEGVPGRSAMAEVQVTGVRAWRSS